MENNIEKMSISYTAEFIKDIPKLLKMFPPKHEKVFGHHSTIAFKPSNLDGINIGNESMIKINGRVFDEKGDALLVDNPKSNNKNPHITLSCSKGISPFYSNELIEKAIKAGKVEYFKNSFEIEVVEGYSDGVNDIISK